MDATQSDSLLCRASLTVLLLALVFGGGQGHPGDALTQLASLVLIGVLIWRTPDIRQWPSASLWVLPPLLAVLAFLLPWPEAWRVAGAARGALSNNLSSLIGGLPATGALRPLAAERALFWLLPASALYLAGLQLDWRARRTLLQTAVAVLAVGAVLGLAQKAGGIDSALYFYRNTNRGMAVGLFANNNHYAISLACTLPLVWAGLVHLAGQREQRHVHPLRFALPAGIALLFMLGFLLSGSRAGLLLGMAGCLLMLPAVIAADRHTGAKHWLFALMAVGLFLAVQLGLYFISLQFVPNPLEDSRWQIFAGTRAAADAYAPLGAGPGAFWYAFQHVDPFLGGPKMVNHAHNDYLEIWLELRWFGALAGALLLGAFLWQGVRVWFMAGLHSVRATLMARAAWVGLLLLLLHSLVDYPLRTTALSALAGLLAACVVWPRGEPGVSGRSDGM